MAARREVPAASASATLVLLFLIYFGSRGLRDFDAALVGYAVGSVFAFAVYRYTLWITRPPTWREWKAGWTNFLSWRNFRQYTAFIPVAWWTDIFAQTFIHKRGLQRWIMHMSIFWGVVLSCAVTFPADIRLDPLHPGAARPVRSVVFRGGHLPVPHRGGHRLRDLPRTGLDGRPADCRPGDRILPPNGRLRMFVGFRICQVEAQSNIPSAWAARRLARVAYVETCSRIAPRWRMPHIRTSSEGIKAPGTTMNRIQPR